MPGESTGHPHERAPRGAGSGEPDADASQRAVPRSDRRPAWNLQGPRTSPWQRLSEAPRRCACAPSCAAAQSRREWTCVRRQQLRRARPRGPAPSTRHPPRSPRPGPCPRRWWPSPRRRTGVSCGHESVPGRRPGARRTERAAIHLAPRACAHAHQTSPPDPTGRAASNTREHLRANTIDPRPSRRAAPPGRKGATRVRRQRNRPDTAQKKTPVPCESGRASSARAG